MENQSFNVLPENTAQQDPNAAAGAAMEFQKPASVTAAPGSLSQHQSLAAKQSQESGIYPEFSIKPVKNNFKSEQKGYPVYDDVQWLTIRVAGDKNNVIERKARKDDKEKYPHHYAMFEAGERVADTGMPIEQWTAISRSQAATLKALNIYTVEALATISDQGIINIGMGGRELVEEAKAFLAAAADVAEPQRLAVENDRHKSQIQALEQQISDLGKHMEDYEALQEENATLKQQVTELQGQNAQLQAENSALQANAKKAPKKPVKPKTAPKPKAN